VAQAGSWRYETIRERFYRSVTESNPEGKKKENDNRARVQR